MRLLLRVSYVGSGLFIYQLLKRVLDDVRFGCKLSGARGWSKTAVGLGASSDNTAVLYLVATILFCWMCRSSYALELALYVECDLFFFFCTGLAG